MIGKTNNKHIVVVIGHSGAGKSTLAKKLGEYLSCDVLNFNYAGKELAQETKDSTRFREINDYIYCCIKAAFCTATTLVIDGLASDDIILKLKDDGLSVIVIFVDVPYDERIKRMMARENCTEEVARAVEGIKEQGKAKAGLISVIEGANLIVDGRTNKQQILYEVIEFLAENYGIREF